MTKGIHNTTSCRLFLLQQLKQTQFIVLPWLKKTFSPKRIKKAKQISTIQNNEKSTFILKPFNNKVLYSADY